MANFKECKIFKKPVIIMVVFPLTKKNGFFVQGYEVIMAFLALVLFGVLLIEFLVPLSEQQLHLLAKVDILILTAFAADYFYKLKKSKNKMAYFKGHLIDLVAILPIDSFLRIAKISALAEVFRITRVARMIVFFRRTVCGFLKLIKTNGLHYMIAFTTAIIIFGAYGALYFERSSGTITTFGDALWWSLVTTTTVGYGDMAPVTAGGRILAAFLMLTGIGFLGMVTGSVATYFLNRVVTGNTEGKKSVADEEIEYIKQKLDEINSLSKDDVVTLNRVIISIWEQKHLQRNSI